MLLIKCDQFLLDIMDWRADIKFSPFWEKSELRGVIYKFPTHFYVLEEFLMQHSLQA